MYRMIIVDDLPIIVQGLMDLFSSQEDLTLYPAYSGYEALEVLKREKIDIVLSDIKMPGMEGIELLHEVRKYWPACKVIFLTSYDDFHYVKSAISGGGSDYLLKTETSDAIQAAVHKAITELESEYEAKKRLHQAQMAKKQAIPLLQQQYLHGLMHRESRPSPEKLSEQLRHMDIPLSSDRPVLLLVGRIDSWGDKADAVDRKLMLYAVQNIAEEYLSSSTRLVSSVYEELNLFWLLQPQGEQPATGDVIAEEAVWSHTFTFCFAMLESIQRACRDILKLPVSFVMSETPLPWNQLADKFETMQTIFLTEPGAGTELRLTDVTAGKTEGTSDSDKSRLLSSKTKKIDLLRHYLENGAEGEFNQLYNEIMDTGGETYSGFMRLEMYHSLASVFLSYLNLHPTASAVFAQIDASRLTHVERSVTWEEMQQYFARLAALIFAYRAEKPMQNEHDVVSWMNDYIRKHLADDLSLTHLAEQAHLHPAYLSRLYKQITGISLTDMINHCRLEKAKELLKASHYKIYEIAGLVGYDSRLSFIRFFKTQMSMTPQDYRDL
ncbi:response regulator [Paenibacillus eucommiae]|uniref:Two-component system response regulator YesN n=1 Tax=Paenibacillus eucommiae TaxID=1355755 RepID=A0ABS4JAL1_9BACL|nr:response regulator [Paenibacillus eucommiae]MBP1996894.1 two-component system response regulator YesN [Paenibacillus eucommiae]